MDLSIPAFNSLLDCLTISTTREAKGSVLRELISKTTAGEMNWVLRIIIKDLRIELGKNYILDEIHLDARDMMASCIDLKNVCLHLHSHSVRYLCQDLVVGKPSSVNTPSK
jgi:DNA ligase-4